MARKASAGSRGVGLYGVTFIEQPLVVKLLEQPPQRLDILVVVGDVGMLHVDEVAHFLCQLLPLGCELHHVLTALVVVVFRRDIFWGCVVVNVFLGDTQLFLYT